MKRYYNNSIVSAKLSGDKVYTLAHGGRVNEIYLPSGIKHTYELEDEVKGYTSSVEITLVSTNEINPLATKSNTGNLPVLARVVGLYKRSYKKKKDRTKRRNVIKGRIVSVGTSLGIVKRGDITRMIIRKFNIKGSLRDYKYYRNFERKRIRKRGLKYMNVGRLIPLIISHVLDEFVPVYKNIIIGSTFIIQYTKSIIYNHIIKLVHPKVKGKVLKYRDNKSTDIIMLQLMEATLEVLAKMSGISMSNKLVDNSVNVTYNSPMLKEKVSIIYYNGKLRYSKIIVRFYDRLNTRKNRKMIRMIKHILKRRHKKILCRYRRKIRVLREIGKLYRVQFNKRHKKHGMVYHLV